MHVPQTQGPTGRRRDAKSGVSGHTCERAGSQNTILKCLDNVSDQLCDIWTGLEAYRHRFDAVSRQRESYYGISI